MFPIIKSFFYKITDPFYCECIQVNINKYPTVLDFKEIISTIWNYSDIIINNPPDEDRLKKIEEHYVFDITIRNRCKSSTFCMPDSQIIRIKNSYEMRIEEIFEKFRKSFFFNLKKCMVHHIHFYLLGNEIPRKEFPFLAIPKGEIVEVKLSCDAIVLNYGEYKFFFCENETADKAYKLIQKVFKGYHSISITNNQKEKLNYYDQLVRYDDYSIKVIYKFIFENIESHSEFIQKLDLLSNVFDAKNALAKIYKKDIKDIVLFDENMEKINNDNELLINIHLLNYTFKFEVENNYFLNEIKLKNYPKTPDIKFKNHSTTTDIDIILKRPVYSKTPEHKNAFSFNQKEPEIETDFNQQKICLISNKKLSPNDKIHKPDTTNDQKTYDLKQKYKSYTTNNQKTYDLKQKYKQDTTNNQKTYDLKQKHKQDTTNNQKTYDLKQKHKQDTTNMNKSSQIRSIYDDYFDNKIDSDKIKKSNQNASLNKKQKVPKEKCSNINSNKTSKKAIKKEDKIKLHKTKNDDTKVKSKFKSKENENKTKKYILRKEIIIEEEEEENSYKSDDKQTNSKKIINIYDDFYQKEAKLESSFKYNSSKIKLNDDKKETNNLLIEEEEEESEKNSKNDNEKNICKSISEDNASEIEMNSSDKYNISDIHSNHLTLSPNCHSMHLSELQSEIIEEEEEVTD